MKTLLLASSAVLWIAKQKPGIGRVRFLMCIVEGMPLDVPGTLLKIHGLVQMAEKEYEFDLIDRLYELRDEIVQYAYADKKPPEAKTNTVNIQPDIKLGDTYYVLEGSKAVCKIMTPETVRDCNEYLNVNIAETAAKMQVTEQLRKGG